MKFLKYSFALFLIFFSVSVGFSQEETIVLNTKELGPHERPLVRFPHQQHSDLIECARCHHDYDKYKFNVGGEGQGCKECHVRHGSKDNRVPLLEAFHSQCKSCHSDLMSKNEANLPVMCGQCHNK